MSSTKLNVQISNYVHSLSRSAYTVFILMLCKTQFKLIVNPMCETMSTSSKLVFFKATIYHSIGFTDRKTSSFALA